MTSVFEKQLPPNCHIDHGIYVRFQKQIKGKKYNYQLGKISDGHDLLFNVYHNVLRNINNKPQPSSLDWISKKFIDSTEYKDLALSTQKRYICASRILQHQIKKNGKCIKFGKMPVVALTKPFLREIMKKRLDQYKANGKKGDSAVNYEVAFLSSMLSWSINNISGLPYSINPIHGIRLLKAPKNERYVSHVEYHAQLNQASELLQALFEVTYLCACRGIETRNLRESDDLGDKLLIRRTKGSKHTYITISERLRLAIDKAKALRPRPKITVLNEDRFIFTNQNGYQITSDGLKSAMSRLKKKVGADYWYLHLLKSKGISDAKDKNIAGLTETMKKRYNTKIQTHEAVD